MRRTIPSNTTYSRNYEFEFPWVEEHRPCATKAYCKWCRKIIEISSMGKRALTSHEKSSKYISNSKFHAKSLHVDFFMKAQASVATSDLASTKCSSTQPDSVQGSEVSEIGIQECHKILNDPAMNSMEKSFSIPTTNPRFSAKTSTHVPVLQKILLKDSVTKAEITWCLLTVFKHYSFRGAAEAVAVFPRMFPDSEIAAKMQLQKDKVGYTIVHGLAPHFRKQIKEIIKSCNHIVVGFDESLNRISKKQQMDVVLKFWNSLKNEVETRYLSSVFLESTKAMDLKNGLIMAVQEENLTKIIQISMDGPAVNFCMIKNLKAELHENYPENHLLLDIGSCGLHNVHGGFRTGIQNTKWNIGDFLTSLYRLFKASPARRGHYTSITKSDIFPHKFCSIRWVENTPTATRADVMLPFLKVWVSAVEREGKKNSLNDNHQSFQVVSTFVKDKFLEAKLAFFISTSSLVEPFLTEFQSDAPMAPFLYQKLTYVLTTIMERFVKPDVLEKATSISDVDLRNPKNIFPVANVDIGFQTKGALKAITPKPCAEEITNFKTYARQCYIFMTEKLMERSPLKYKFTKSISCLDPNVISESPKAAEKRLISCLEILSIEKNMISGSKADRIKREYKQICSLSSTMEAMKMYERSTSRLDTFWTGVIATTGKSFPDLTDFLKLILVLSHGNAALERGFSVNSECIIENQQEESLIALRLIYDTIRVVGGIEQIPITKDMITDVRNGHFKYHELLKSKKEQNKQKLEEEKEKKRIVEETRNLQTKKRKLMQDTVNQVEVIEEQISVLFKSTKRH